MQKLKSKSKSLDQWATTLKLFLSEQEHVSGAVIESNRIQFELLVRNMYLPYQAEMTFVKFCTLYTFFFFF